MKCPQCQHDCPPEFAFCPMCGAALTAAPAPDALDAAVRRWIPRELAERLRAAGGRVGKERRTVTILFCDVQGSTALSEDLDPEDVMEIMDGAFDVLIPPVYRYEGTLARLMGDAVLAFFGAPIAHEDDPERACRAALEIIEGVQAYATRLEQERGIPGFDVRVGIHTGLVVVGEVGSDLRVEYTAMGDAVNLAQRLESAAPPGTVLISADTQRLIAALFETHALEPLHVRGRTEPVVAYRVTAPKLVREKPRGVAGLDSPLVGRDAEFTALMAAVDRVRDGEGGIVTIVGEAGIGKSRLVAEVRRAVRARGASPPQWIEGRCLSYSGNVAYQLWTDMLRNWLALPPDAGPLAVREALEAWLQERCPDRAGECSPFLARMMALPLPEESEIALAELNVQQIKEATFQAVKTSIENATRGQSLVLVCEDIYWADATSMELLEQVLPLTARLPLLLLCVFRPRREHPSWHVREAAARHHAGRHTDLWLAPLTEPESGQLVHNLLATETLPDPLHARILHVAEGNPFFVEEILRALIQEGTLQQDAAAGSWNVAEDAASIAIPETVDGVLNARIDRLPEDTRRVLTTASVIGRIFSRRVLASVSQLDGRLDAHLGTLQREEMIRRRTGRAEREYIFAHELTREAAYNGLLKAERRSLHRQVAGALEALYPERIQEHLGLLAHHWERADDPPQAVHYLLRAGDQARMAYAHREALDHFQRAQKLATQHDLPRQAARAWMKLGLTHHATYDFPRARQAYDQGFALWRQASKDRPAELPLAPHALRMDMFPEPVGLDPTRHWDVYSLWVSHHLFGKLAELTPELDVVPELARSWETQDGGMRYVFHLRDDLQWTDGRPVTAEDFAYAWRRVLNPATGAGVAGTFYAIRGARAFHQGEVSDPESVGIHALDEVTLAVDLEAPCAYFLYFAPYWCPLPRHVVEVQGLDWWKPEHIVTCGPFLLESWRRGERLVMVRNPQFPGRFDGNVERVVLHLGNEPAHNVALYEQDELDVLSPEVLPTAQMNLARQRHPAEDLSLPRAATKFLGFHCSQGPFDDLRVRRAFALAINRGALSGVGSFAAFPASGGLIPPGVPGHCPDVALPHDASRARETLAEAGYPGGRGLPPVKLVITEGLEGVCQELQAQWKQVLDVDVAWDSVPWKDYIPQIMAGKLQAYIVGMGAYYPDPDCFLSTERLVGRLRWPHEEYGQLIAQARRLLDPERRLELYAQAESILVEEAPLVPLSYGINFVLVKPWVTRFPTSVLKWPFFKDIVLEPH